MTARTLDFGCGYGRRIERPLKRGDDVWGVDISAREIAKGRVRLDLKGLDPARIRTFDDPYPDGWFERVESVAVFEHVADLDQAVAEIARVTAPGGTGHHTFVARWRPREEHLNMPVVHWLPKNWIRFVAILLFTVLHIEPKRRPRELPRKSGPWTRARFQYRYSCDETFYRSYREIRACFERHGLSVTPVDRFGGRALSLLWRTFASVTFDTTRAA